jgi:hypothetical protein
LCMFLPFRWSFQMNWDARDDEGWGLGRKMGRKTSKTSINSIVGSIGMETVGFM